MEEATLIWIVLGVSVLFNIYNFIKLKIVEKKLEGVAYEIIPDGE